MRQRITKPWNIIEIPPAKKEGDAAGTKRERAGKRARRRAVGRDAHRQIVPYSPKDY